VWLLGGEQPYFNGVILMSEDVVIADVAQGPVPADVVTTAPNTISLNGLTDAQINALLDFVTKLRVTN